MSNNNSSKGRIWLGLILIIVGLLIFMRNFHFHIFNIDILTWPIILMVIGLFIVFRNKDSFFGWLLLIIGGIGLSSRFLNMSFREIISEYWPILLIILGIYTLLKSFRSKEDNELSEISNNEHYLDIFSFFGDKTIIVKTNDFLGGKITSLFSEVQIDLRESRIKQSKVILDSVTLFASTKIFVPNDWEVIIKTLTIFGGFEDNRRRIKHEGEVQKIIVVKGLVMFGGGELKN